MLFCRSPACFVSPAAAAGYCEPAGCHHGKLLSASAAVYFLQSVLSEWISYHLFLAQAQQMTVQAMAMVGSPVSSPPTSPITSPPMSPMLHHLPSPYAPAGHFAVMPPSPYAYIPPSPYANFSPTPYTAADIPPSPYLPIARHEQIQPQPQAQPHADPAAQPQPGAPCPDSNPQPSSTITEPGQPKDSASAQVSNSEIYEAIVQNGLLYNVSVLFKSKSYCKPQPQQARMMSKNWSNLK